MKVRVDVFAVCMALLPIWGEDRATNRNSDGWFMGFTPSLVSGCMGGGEERDIQFDTMVRRSGLLWHFHLGTYMQKVYKESRVWDILRGEISIYLEFRPLQPITDGQFFEQQKQYEVWILF